MHVVDVCAFYAPTGGGVRTYIDQKLAIADRFGHRVTVIVPGEGNASEMRGPRARIVSLKGPRFPLDRAYRYFADEPALHAALDALQPDLVEVSSPWRSPSMVARWQPRVPKAMVMHADPLATYAYRWFEPMLERGTIDRGVDRYWRHLRDLSRSYDTVVCASSELARRLTEGGVERIRTIPMGVAGNLFSPLRRDANVRAELLRKCGLPDHALLLIAAGRLAPEKRVPMLVRAATAAGVHVPVGLAIFGQGRDLPAILGAIGGNPHIRVFEPVRDRAAFADILASCDALLHGCESETFCMAGAEARASGIAVVAPDRGGAADHAWPAALRFRANDPDSAARAIVRLAGDGQLPERGETRTMEEHFAELFVHYGHIIEGLRVAA